MLACLRASRSRVTSVLGRPLDAHVRRLQQVLERYTAGPPGAERRSLSVLLAFIVKLHLIVWQNNAAPESHVIGAYLRYWLWQIWRRALRRPVTVRLPTGGVLCVPVWSQIGGMLIATGFTEVRDQVFVQRLVRPGDLFLDAGANIGLYSVIAASAGALVEAFEPAPRAAAALRHNLTLSTQSHFVVHEVALSDHSGVAYLTQGDVTAHLADSGELVQTARLDDIDLGSAGELTVLKIDAEGHDAAVLRGATRILTTRRCVVLIEVWSAEDEIRKTLAELGYQPHGFDHVAGLLQDESASSPNVIYFPESIAGLVHARLAEPKPLTGLEVDWRGELVR